MQDAGTRIRCLDRPPRPQVSFVLVAVMNIHTKSVPGRSIYKGAESFSRPQLRPQLRPLSAPRRSFPPRPPSTRPLLVSRSCSTSCLSLPGDALAPRGKSECSGDPRGVEDPTRVTGRQPLCTFSRINLFMKLVQPILLGPDLYSSRTRGAWGEEECLFRAHAGPGGGRK
jgi:hypothetical protein